MKLYVNPKKVQAVQPLALRKIRSYRFSGYHRSIGSYGFRKTSTSRCHPEKVRNFDSWKAGHGLEGLFPITLGSMYGIFILPTFSHECGHFSPFMEVNIPYTDPTGIENGNMPFLIIMSVSL